MKNFIITFLILFGIWLMLNGSLDMQIVISGLIISVLISALLCSRCQLFGNLRLTPKAFYTTVIYIFVFLFDLIKSNIEVALIVLKPTLPIKPGIVEVKTQLKSKFARMLLANSITLTPGTLTVEIIEDSFFIHWINVQEIDVEKASKQIVENFEKYLKEIYD